MCDDEIDTCQGFMQCYLVLYEQIGSFSLEALVRLFLHDNDDITRLLTRVLISLAMERELAIVGCTLVN